MMKKNDVIAHRYLLENRLGSGGMSEVWLAQDQKLERSVAIKILHDRLLDSSALRDRFLREASLTAKLSHPHIVPVFDQGILDDGKPYIVMEYIMGETLTRRKSRGITEDKTLLIFDQILQGVGAAHKAGIVHRDLKPDNILIDENDSVHIFDFGVARNTRDLGTDTESGTIIGTARYLSPEQAHGEVADERSDLYSVGIILYEILAGKTPWESYTAISALVHQSTEPADPPSKLNPEVPARLDAITLRAIAYRADLRFGSAEEFRQALQNKEPSSKRWLLVIPIIALLLLLLGWWYWSGFRTVPSLQGKNLLQARSSLFEEDLSWVSKRSPSDQPPGTILLSSPDEGERVREGSVVVLFVSSGPEEKLVPNTIGLNAEDAVSLIKKNGFLWKIQREPSLKKNGTVLATSPSPEEPLAEGKEVMVYISENKTETLRPPNCRGLLEEECRPLLSLFSVRANPIPSTEIKGTVIRQSFSPPRMVTLFVSEGSSGNTVPDLIGLSLSAAQERLAETSLAALVQYRETENSSEFGKIIKQRPGGGSVGQTEVLLVVGKKAK